MPATQTPATDGGAVPDYKVGPSCVLTSPELTLHTDRLRIVAATPALALAALENRKRFGILLEATPDPEWPTSIISSALTYFADTLTNQPELSGWLVWYVILKEGPGRERVIGSCGFAGPPADDKSVRLGFALVSAYRGRGYASEAAKALTGWAFAHGAQRIWSKIPADNAAAAKLLHNVGMHPTGESTDDGSLLFEMHKV